MARTVTWLALVLLPTSVSWGGPGDADEGWRVVRQEHDGLVLEARRVPDTRFEELRVRGRVALAPEALADAAWVWNPEGPEAALVQRRRVLAESADERLVFQLIQAPIVSARESLIRFRRERDGARRLIRIRFHSETGADAGSPGAVTVTLVRGEWSFGSDGEGGTWLEHRCLSDPGGALAPWVVAPTQQALALALVRDAIVRARP
ncbi:MAG: hypothetical protein SFW67_12200 [Myxococcaceae bacterium]|nr:hypothetical protein [Myxococcaceae bacterium]